MIWFDEKIERLFEMNFFAISGANRLDQGSDEDVFNDEASVISNVSSGSLAKDEGEFVYIFCFVYLYNFF